MPDRVPFETTVEDQAGNVIRNAVVLLRENNTSTPVTDAFPSKVGGVAQSSFTTDASGKIKCWFTTPRYIRTVTTDNGHTAVYPDAPSGLLTFPDKPRDDVEVDSNPTGEVTNLRYATHASMAADTGQPNNTVALVENTDRVYWWRTDHTAWVPVTAPSPHVDDFGGDPLGATDSAQAIRDGLTYCSAHGLHSLAFSPGTYKVLSSVALTQTYPTGHFTFHRSGDPGDVRIIPPVDGITPAFTLTNRLQATNFDDLSAYAGRFLRATGCAGTRLNNVIANSGVAGVSPVQLINCFESGWTGTKSSSENPTHTPCLELIGDSFVTPVGAATTTYLTTVRDWVPTGGPIRVIQSGDSGSDGGQNVFEALVYEGLVGDPMLSYESGIAYYDAVLTSGSPAVVCASGSFVGGDVGKIISGPGIPSNTTILAVADATHLTLSTNALATCPTATLVINRTITWGGWPKQSLTRLGLYDSSGNVNFARAACSGLVELLLDSCYLTGISRPVEDVSAGIFATWLGPLGLATPLVQTPAGAESTRGRSLVLGDNGVRLRVSTGEPAFTEINGRRHYVVTGTPEGVVTGSKGDTCSRTDGGSGTTFYVKESGDATNTGWNAVGDQHGVPDQKTADYTLVLLDADHTIEMASASAHNITVPTNASVAFPIGTTIHVNQLLAGQVTLVAAGGVSLQSSNGLKTRATFSEVILRKRGTDAWVVYGDTAV